MINQTFKSINRSLEIIRVLLKYGFEDVVAHSPLKRFLPESKRIAWSITDKADHDISRYERIRMVVEELGPTFVKLAQVLSNRPDVLPTELINEFEKLQDKVPPFDSKIAVQIIESEIGRPIDQVFEHFEMEPIASASIGQVHKARLLDGKQVVVKVQRPDIHKVIDRDLSIMHEIVRRGEDYFHRQGVLNIDDVLKAFEKTMHQELDYRNEARNIDKFRNQYAYMPELYIPKAYDDLSTKKVLVVEFAQGCKVSDVQQIRAWGLDPKQIAENGMKIYLTMIFEYGLFHADPHPGNVFVRRDGVITLIDFGMVGRLMRREKFALAQVFISMADEDARAMAQNFKRLAIEDDIKDFRAFERDCYELIVDFSDTEIAETSMADLVPRLQKIIYDYKLRVPGSTFLIFRALAILEGIGRQVHPSFNTTEFLKPFGKKLIAERYSPKVLWEDFSFSMSQINALIFSMPMELKSILQKTRKGQLRFEVKHTGYDYLLERFNSMANRMIIGMVTSALFVASAIIMTADVSKDAMNIDGIPYLSLIGFGTATFLCIVLLYLMLKSRKS
jgi:ubiquinone biosynthesis protein